MKNADPVVSMINVSQERATKFGAMAFRELFLPSAGKAVSGDFLCASSRSSIQSHHIYNGLTTS